MKIFSILFSILSIAVLVAVATVSTWLFFFGNQMVADQLAADVQEFAVSEALPTKAHSALEQMVSNIRKHPTWNGMLLRDYVQTMILDDELSDDEIRFLEVFTARVSGRDLSNSEVEKLLKDLEKELDMPLVLTFMDFS